MARRSEMPPVAHLNSVWVEGTMVAEPDDVRSHGGMPGYRFHLQGGPSVFLVEAPVKAVDAGRERLVRGRTVRVIGRLEQHHWMDGGGLSHDDIKIVGELVEALGGPGN